MISMRVMFVVVLLLVANSHEIFFCFSNSCFANQDFFFLVDCNEIK